MKLEVELPEEVIGELRRLSTARNLTIQEYATELVYQLLASRSMGADVPIASRPDWQAALERSRADLARGRIMPHDEVEAWHKRHFK